MENIFLCNTYVLTTTGSLKNYSSEKKEFVLKLYFQHYSLTKDIQWMMMLMVILP